MVRFSEMGKIGERRREVEEGEQLVPTGANLPCSHYAAEECINKKKRGTFLCFNFVQSFIFVIFASLHNHL